MPSGNEIRSTFLKFFAERGHRVVRSSSLVPTNDPTLLFTNAGMNQFKDVFLGLEQREYTRATTSQKCVRAGGKHNDLENVGFTNRHHTFFEMLGNFSFGDYFKKDAIAYAWELITSPKWFGIPVEKLTFTVFGGAEVAPGKILGVDEEARDLWVSVGAPRDSVIPIPGLKENFWAMGDTGPCGPCSEIHYDMGPAASDKSHTNCEFGCECGRYVEIWNLVFMQFNRDASAKVEPLPKPSIDTGAGLERLAAVLQGKISNFDTDLFVPLIQRAADLTGTRPGASPRSDASLRIIADHARAATFLISDGVIPSNEGREYVVRRIVRRAMDFARELGASSHILSTMGNLVVDQMRETYPELEESRPRIAAVLAAEAEKYDRLVEPAIENLEKFVQQRYFRKTPSPSGVVYEHLLDGNSTATTFHYAYTTLGLRLESVMDWAKTRRIKLDPSGKQEFERLLDEDRIKARASWKGGHKSVANPVYSELVQNYQTHRTVTDFYSSTEDKDSRIRSIMTTHGSVDEIKPGEIGEVVLDRTTIYAESGGQVADTGGFYDNSGTQLLAEVRGAYYPVAGLVAHRIVARENFHVGDQVMVKADGARREHIKRNHTATHLMHATLRKNLGMHVKQAGSLVDPAHLRFDFSHFAAIDPADLREIEQQVNDEILLNSKIETNTTTLDDALASGALAFFGDRYPEQNVRVVTIPDPSAPRGFYSKELCGGTHVNRTGDIGIFKIIVEQSAAAGVRRIEAITGTAALADYQRAQQLLRDLSARMGVNEENLAAAMERAEQTQKLLERQLEALKRKGALSKLDDLIAQARTIKGVKIISAELEGVDRESMRQLVDSLRQKLGSGVVVLGTIEDGKVALLAGITKDLTSKLHAGKIIQATAKLVGGSGGGRPDLAEAGGKDTSGLKTALDHVYPLIDQLL